MKKIRIMCALLAMLMLFGSFASCAENDETVETDSQSVTAADSESTDEEQVQDDLPADLRFEGEEIVIISRDREGWTADEISAEAVSGNVISDAIIERNKKIEERLGFSINNIAENEHDPSVIVNKVATTVRSGTHEYDVLACACYTSLTESLNGTFADLRTTDYINFDKPWWSQGFNEAIEYRGSQYAATGSMLLSMYRFAFVTVFNKDMFDDNQVPYLYEDVKNKTWTLDRQIELVPIFHNDAVNQGSQDENGDIFGLVTNDYISVDPYWSACDVEILRKTSSGEYEFVFESSKLHEVAEKVLKLFYETGNSVYDYKHEGLDDEQVYIREMFANGNAAMATLRLMEMESSVIRDMSDKYGIVPMPKFDVAQEEYKTLLHDQFTVFTIPNTAGNDRKHMISALLEAMGSESHYTVRPAYYETTLRSKIAQDPESAQMLDTIVENIYIDAGIIYTSSLASFHDKFRQIIGSKTNTVISAYKSLSAKVEKRDLIVMIAKLEKIQEIN